MKKSFFILALLTILLLISCNENLFIDGPTVSVRNLRDRAIQIVREGLSDENGVIRSHAIEVVSVTNTHQLMPKVTELVSDQFVAVRFAAVTAIGDTGYKPGISNAGRLLEDINKNAKMAAAYAMTKTGKTDYSNIIRNLAKSREQTVRANAALLLGKLGDKDDLALLYWVLRDSYSLDKAKIQAIESIAMLGDRRIYRGKLLSMLYSKQADDRVMGIRGMGALGTIDAKNAIIRKLDDEVLEVRLCAAEELGKLKDTTGTSEILDYFTKESPDLDKTSMANIIATMAIGRIQGPTLTKFLPILLQSKSKEIRLSAAQSVLLLEQ